MHIHEAGGGGTNWLAVVLTMLTPLAIAASFAYAAFLPRAAGEEWYWALFALLPIEIVRGMAYSILGGIYKDYGNSRRSALSFAAAMLMLAALVLAVLILLWLLIVIRHHQLMNAPVNPRVLCALVIPTAVIAANGAIVLYFFRGNTRGEAARVQAAADDVMDWIGLCILPAPLLLLAVFVLYVWLGHKTDALIAWFSDPGFIKAVRPAASLFAAYYFVGNAVLSGYVHTARLNRSGHRLLNIPWVQYLMARKGDDPKKQRAVENARERERKAALELENVPGQSARNKPKPIPRR